MSQLFVCELCERRVSHVTKHHLIPKTRHKNKKNKKLFDRQEIHERVLWLCKPCHKTVHATLTEKELERDYNTRELILAHPDIAKFVAWIATKPDGTNVPVRSNSAKSIKWK